jgi:hypothetical protein
MKYSVADSGISRRSDGSDKKNVKQYGYKNGLKSKTKLISCVVVLSGLFFALAIPQFSAYRTETIDPDFVKIPKEGGRLLPSEPRDSEMEVSTKSKSEPDVVYMDNNNMMVYKRAELESLYKSPSIHESKQVVKEQQEQIEKIAQGEAGEELTKCIEGDCIDGQGTLVLSDGDKFSGVFRNRQFYEGIYFFHNGEKFEGRWECGEFYEGTKTSPNGEKHVGKWKDFKPHGPGVHTWPDGKRYEGNFVAGKMDGKGILTYPDGSYTIGSWANGEPVGVIKVPAGGTGSQSS